MIPASRFLRNVKTLNSLPSVPAMLPSIVPPVMMSVLELYTPPPATLEVLLLMVTSVSVMGAVV